jgi:hypothetical protein
MTGFDVMAKAKSDSEDFEPQESQRRFEAALKGAMNTPHKPLKEKPKAKKKSPPAIAAISTILKISRSGSAT